MKKRLIITIVIVIMSLSSCRRGLDDTCFNGQIKLIDDDVKVEKVALKEVTLDGAFWGFPTICDNFIIFWNNKLTKSFFQIFNLHTGAYIGDFVNQGGGPDEAYTVPYIFQIYEDHGSMKTLLIAFNEQKLLEWNISQSIEHRETIIDTVIPYEKNPNGYFNYMFRLADDTLVTCIDPQMLSMDGDIASTPFYQKRTIYYNRPTGNIRPYNQQTVQKGDTQIPVDFYFNSADCIKPDRTKIVQAMEYLCQINIIDLVNAQIIGYRINKTPDFSVFYSGKKKLKQHFRRVQADDNYIYALYFGETIASSSEKKDPDLVYIFDWNGNPVKKLKLEYLVREMAIDTKNNTLYFLDAKDDILYCCDLNALNLK
jgi:hypothetical protein